MTRRVFLGLLSASGFCLLAILNVGGYRYGVQDQSFYVPAVLQQLDPGLYQRDAEILGAQDIFFIFDEALAYLVHLTGLSVPVIFFIVFLVGLALLGAATAAMGWSLYGSWWTAAVLTVGLTLRHRISMPGVNTLEAYLHPRMLAFAVGVWALTLFLRGRPWFALALTVAAAGLHPTMALWFFVLIGTAVLISDQPLRRPLLTAGICLAPASLWIAVTVLGDRFVRMDPDWLALMVHKTYLFSTDWTWTAWLANLGTAALLFAIYLYRRRRGLISTRETGLMAGCAALLLLFIATLPLVEMRIALAVQLQIGRIFWLLDFLALASLAWLVTESDVWERWRWAPGIARRVALGVILLTALVRGSYVSFIEHPERPVVASGPADSDWTRAMEWIARTPRGSHVLADPAHAWRHGTSVRVTGERDVFLEEVKDPALAIYSRDVAQRVLDRIHDLGQFESLTTEHAQKLADKYDLHYLVADRSFDLPLAHRAGTVGIYTLHSPPVARIATLTGPSMP